MPTIHKWTLSVLILVAPLVAAAQVAVQPAVSKPPVVLKPALSAPVAKPVPALKPGVLNPATRAQLSPKFAPATGVPDKQALFETLRRSREQAAAAARAAEARAYIDQSNAESENSERKRIAMGYTFRHAQGRDCDDNDAGVHRRANEVCDGRDNNCDGAVDEGQQLAFFLDADGDGHGDPGQRLLACPIDQQYAARDGRWLVLVGNDCNDADPSRWQGCTP